MRKGVDQGRISTGVVAAAGLIDRGIRDTTGRVEEAALLQRMGMWDVFLCHSSIDSDLTEQVFEAVEKAGHRCFFSKHSIPPGVTWPAAIVQAVEASRVLVLVLSDTANESEEVLREVTLASQNKIPVIPFLLTTDPISDGLKYYLHSRQWLDAQDEPKGQIPQLVESISTTLLVTEAPEDPDPPEPVPSEPGVSTESESSSGSRSRLILLTGLTIASLSAVLYTVLTSSWFQHDKPPVGAAGVTSTRMEGGEGHDVESRREVVIENSQGMFFRRVEPGEFLMGSPESVNSYDAKHRDADEKQHPVRLTKPYYFGVHEVTRSQFRAFVVSSGYATEAKELGAFYHNGREFKRDPGMYWDHPRFYQTDEHPVVCVDWNDAMAFCEWLSETEGETYRLPSEAEWEYACRAGSVTSFPWGEDRNRARGRANVGAKKSKDDIEFGFEDLWPETSPVGALAANAWGFHDMIGNVMEWCFDAHAHYGSEKRVDPVNREGREKVLRGGSHATNAKRSRTAHRFRDPPNRGMTLSGFRVVLEVRG